SSTSSLLAKDLTNSWRSVGCRTSSQSAEPEPDGVHSRCEKALGLLCPTTTRRSSAVIAMVDPPTWFAHELWLHSGTTLPGKQKSWPSNAVRRPLLDRKVMPSASLVIRVSK